MNNMATEFDKIIAPGIKGLTPYIPGKPVDELERELGISQAVKLASNENPLGPSPLAIQALMQSIDGVHIYPDGDCFQLKQALAEHLGVERKQITIGNGSNEIIELVSRLFSGPGIDVIVSEYSFAIYEIVAQALSANCIKVPAKNWGHDLEAMLAAVTPKTRIIFIANPNNPTGTYLTSDELQSFLQQLPEQVIVVLDEAYFEYVGRDDYPDGVALLSQFDNLIVMRTFSKIFGIAGLRVGYSISHEKLADYLNRARQPFNVNLLAQHAAKAALQDGQHLQASLDTNNRGLKQLQAGFSQMGIEFIPSVGNFICFQIRQDANECFNALLQKGVIIRPLASYAMPKHLRITVGREEENQRFLDALTEVLKA